MKKLTGIWLLCLLVVSSARACFNPADQWAAGVVFNNGETIDLSLINGCGEEGTNYIAERDSGLITYIKYRSTYDPAHAMVYLGYFNVTFNSVYNVPRLAVILDSTQDKAQFDFAKAVRKELDVLSSIGILDMTAPARQETEDSLAATGEGNAQYWTLQKQVLAYNSFFAYDEKTGTWDMLAANTYRACGLDVAYELPPQGLQTSAISPFIAPVQLDKELVVTVSPNPFSIITTVHLQKNLPLSGATVYIYNTQGEEIRKLETHDRAEVTWNTAGLPGGVYLLRAGIAGQTFTQKVVLQR